MALDVPTYLMAKGGGGGTSDYSDLTNKPSINGVTLTGNKTAEDLGIINNVKYIGQDTDYGQQNPLDLNTLGKGIYIIESPNGRAILNLKATYKGNEITGSITSETNENSRYYWLHIIEPINDDLSSGTVVAYFCNYMFSNSANVNLNGMTGENTALIKIFDNQITTNTYQRRTITAITKDGNQSISGKKTFTTLPESSVTPTANNQLVNKAYVDGLVGDINTVLATLTTPSNGGNE